MPLWKKDEREVLLEQDYFALSMGGESGGKSCAFLLTPLSRRGLCKVARYMQQIEVLRELQPGWEGASLAHFLPAFG